MEIILRETNAREWECYLTGDSNFRYQIFPEYKANRLGKPRPQHLAACKQRLRQEWGALDVEGMEADDQLGIRQRASGLDDSIICSIDKDLLQVPGWHYNFVKKERVYVSPLDGMRHFYYQLLVGDAADGIKGAPGIGPVKARKILAECSTELELYDACRVWFSCDDELVMNAQILHIWQKENDVWISPYERLSYDR